MRKLASLLLVFGLVVGVAACSSDDSSTSDDERSSRDDNDDNSGETISGGGFDFGLGGSGGGDELSNREVLEIIQDYWDERAGDVFGVEYERLPDDRIAGLPGDPAPTCGGIAITPEDVEQNAFAAPCPEGLTVAWDPNLVDGTLTDLFGRAGPAVVFAHEWGHIMQFQSGILDISGQGFGDPPSVITENQADCFSGAWVAQQVDDGVGPFSDAGSLDDAIGAMIYVRDQPGSDPLGELAHGSGFDRVRAFQDGYNRGPEFCATYIEDPPFIDQLPFTGQDAANQGNLAFDEVVPLVIQDLDDFFGANVDGFDSPGDPFDVVPQDELAQLHAEIGDGAVATVMAMLWAEQAQEAAGEDLDGEGPLLQRSCLVGAWLGDILRDQRDGTTERESGVSLSPGDLDETIITFLQLTSEAMSEGGTGFEAIGDMRTGVFGGIEDCRLGE